MKPLSRRGHLIGLLACNALAWVVIALTALSASAADGENNEVRILQCDDAKGVAAFGRSGSDALLQQ